MIFHRNSNSFGGKGARESGVGRYHMIQVIQVCTCNDVTKALCSQ